MGNLKWLDGDQPSVGRDALEAGANETAPADACRRALANLDLLAVTASGDRESTPRLSARVPRRRRARWALGVALGLGAASAAAAVATTFERFTENSEASDARAKMPPRQIPPAKPQAHQSAPARAMVPETPEATTPAPDIEGPDRQNSGSPHSAAARPGKARTGERTATRKHVAARERAATSVPARAPASADSPAVTTTQVSLRDEVDLLDRARAALARGAAGEALSILDVYSGRHPQGQLRKEVAVVRAEALRKKWESSRVTGDRRMP